MGDQNPDHREDLLSPVLESEKVAVPRFSTRAEFLTAFFGGPFAIILFSGLNASHMGRLQRDAWRYVLVSIVGAAFVFWMLVLSVADTPPVWTTEIFGDEFKRAVRWVIRGFGLAVWFVLWLPYRRYHRAAEVMGVAAMSPWGPAIGCIVAAFVIQMGFGAVAMALAR